METLRKADGQIIKNQEIIKQILDGIEKAKSNQEENGKPLLNSYDNHMSEIRKVLKSNNEMRQNNLKKSRDIEQEISLANQNIINLDIKPHIAKFSRQIR